MSSTTATDVQPVLTPGQAIPFVVGSETFETWYTTTTAASPSSGRPLVVLHGGPGCTHNYLLSLAALAKNHNIPVIFYDQIGNGLSSHVPKALSTFWEPSLFMNELENVLKHLEVEGDFDLFGHSWGGMLAAQFAAERQPKGLKRLILSDTPSSMALWERACQEHLHELPPDVQETIKKHEEDGTTDSPEYQAASGIYYKKHVCRLETWPDELNKTFEWVAKDPTVYGTMNGPSEFTITGSLKPWTIIPKLNLVSPSISTLLLNGRYDAADSQAMMPFFKNLSKVKWITLDGASHTPQWEEKERYLSIIGEFLTGA